MADIFGKNRTIKAGNQFASPEYFKLDIEGESGLVQSVKAAYARRIDSLYVIGDPAVYWGYQGGEGSLDVSRYVGKSFFNGAKGNPCGVMSSVKGTVSGSDACSVSGAHVTFKSLALQSVGFQVNAGDTTIIDQVSYKVGELSV